MQRQLQALPGLISGFAGSAQAFQDSLANQPFLMDAALLAIFIVLGVLYESVVHPITIMSTLLSAGIGGLLALMLLRYDFSVIALIGVILLIGIVKKNGIMMVDVAIHEGERKLREGSDPSGLLAAISSHHDDDNGCTPERAPTCIWVRCRIGVTAAAWHRHGRRIADVAIDNALHDPCGLSVTRPFGSICAATIFWPVQVANKRPGVRVNITNMACRCAVTNMSSDKFRELTLRGLETSSAGYEASSAC